uniref:Uncharacterized protein n=1 Tax=Cucumis melo TaxID=3656 RepID=A0A9I9ELA6_CUCME
MYQQHIKCIKPMMCIKCYLIHRVYQQSITSVSTTYQVMRENRSNNARLRDVADDPQQYVRSTYCIPPPVYRGCVRVEEAELDEVYHNVEEVPPTTQS